MNKKERMYIEIEKHGKEIIKYFNLKDQNPLDISKKLFSLERKMHRACEAYCNGTISEGELDIVEVNILSKVKGVLGSLHGIFINHDPRGYALKLNISNFYMKDFGGYGILAPNFKEGG